MDVADPSPKMNVTFPFVVTTIDVESDPSKDASAIIARYGPDARAIKFSGEIKADFQDNDAALLLQVEQIPPSQTSEKVHVFIGVKVSKETFMAELKKTGQSFFAYVHGFTAEPDKSFKTCEIIQSYEKKRGKLRRFSRVLSFQSFGPRWEM